MLENLNKLFINNLCIYYQQSSKSITFQFDQLLSCSIFHFECKDLVIIMKVIQKLLQGVSSQDILDYESHVQLHLKQIMTTINKHVLEDMTNPNIRKYHCYVGCYKYFTEEDQQSQNKAMTWERVTELRTCKQKCRGEVRQMQKFLDNINFYSKKKLSNCSQGCVKQQTEEAQNTCLWECHNRLDRRYKQYWANQKVNIEVKYKI